jgi:hypothetical protein
MQHRADVARQQQNATAAATGEKLRTMQMRFRWCLS